MNADYKTTIGLEIHAELKTQTKMFCGCANNPFEEKPNVNICPICLAHPGTLPTINKKAVELMVQVGQALGGKILEKAHFDRKSYFYPDLPKGYQISQYEEPFVMGGALVDIDITRVHLEEDTARLTHDRNGSYLDYNRAGLPLMELVTEPVIHSSDKAMEFAKELQLILRYLGASDANMERGQMRVEPNISIALADSKKLGIKVELKNINSFKAAKNAIEYEIKRQTKELIAGRSIVQETRGWDEKKKVTKHIRNEEVRFESGNITMIFDEKIDKSDTSSIISFAISDASDTGATYMQRIKEEANDYRYMPEPDLPQVELNSANTEIDIESIKRSVPELPEDKRKRFAKEFGFEDSDILGRLIKDREEASFFENVMSEIDEWISSLSIVDKKSLSLFKEGDAERNALITTTVNIIDSDLIGLMSAEKISWDKLKITPENLSELVILYRKGEITTRVMKDVLLDMFQTGADPTNIIKEKDLGQISDEGKIIEVVKEIIKENEKAVEDYKKGKETVIKFLVGQAMAKLRGRGNPTRLEELFKDNLK